MRVEAFFCPGMTEKEVGPGRWASIGSSAYGHAVGVCHDLFRFVTNFLVRNKPRRGVRHLRSLGLYSEVFSIGGPTMLFSFKGILSLALISITFSSLFLNTSPEFRQISISTIKGGGPGDDKITCFVPGTVYCSGIDETKCIKQECKGNNTVGWACKKDSKELAYNTLGYYLAGGTLDPNVGQTLDRKLPVVYCGKFQNCSSGCIYDKEKDFYGCGVIEGWEKTLSRIPTEPDPDSPSCKKN